MPITSTKPIPISLVDPYLKTARAREHLDSLRREIQAFRESKPYTFEAEDDLVQNRYRVRVRMADLPDRVSLIAGDVFYCLRSSLDQLVYALAKTATRDPERTQFPIIDRWNSQARKRFEQQTRGVPPEVGQYHSVTTTVPCA